MSRTCTTSFVRNQQSISPTFNRFHTSSSPPESPPPPPSPSPLPLSTGASSCFPYSSEQRREDPKIIILSAWPDLDISASLVLLERYISGYRTLFPRSRIVVLTPACSVSAEDGCSDGALSLSLTGRESWEGAAMEGNDEKGEEFIRVGNVESAISDLLSATTAAAELDSDDDGDGLNGLDSKGKYYPLSTDSRQHQNIHKSATAAAAAAAPPPSFLLHILGNSSASQACTLLHAYRSRASSPLNLRAIILDTEPSFLIKALVVWRCVYTAFITLLPPCQLQQGCGERGNDGGGDCEDVLLPPSPPPTTTTTRVNINKTKPPPPPPPPPPSPPHPATTWRALAKSIHAAVIWTFYYSIFAMLSPSLSSTSKTRGSTRTTTRLADVRRCLNDEAIVPRDATRCYLLPDNGLMFLWRNNDNDDDESGGDERRAREDENDDGSSSSSSSSKRLDYAVDEKKTQRRALGGGRGGGQKRGKWRWSGDEERYWTAIEEAWE